MAGERSTPSCIVELHGIEVDLDDKTHITPFLRFLHDKAIGTDHEEVNIINLQSNPIFAG
jgi:hypothetical protein